MSRSMPFLDWLVRTVEYGWWYTKESSSKPSALQSIRCILNTPSGFPGVLHLSLDLVGTALHPGLSRQYDVWLRREYARF